MPVIKLADLAKLYQERLEQLGVNIDSRIYTTRLKNRLLAALPDLRVITKGKDILLIFETAIKEALDVACSYMIIKLWT